MGDSDPELAPRWAQRAARELSGVRLFGDSGWAAARDPGTRSSLVVSAGFHGPPHKHSDELGFCLHAAGEPVLTDPGKYGYDTADPGRGYAQSAAAHNVLVVDGEDFVSPGAEPYGSGLRAAAESDGWYAIAGVNELLRGRGVRHGRLLLFRPGFALIVVDDVRAHGEHTFSQLFHLGPGIKVARSSDPLRVWGERFRGSISHWGEPAPGRSLARGETEPELRGWVFPGYRRWVKAWTVECRAAGAEALLATTVALRPEPVRAMVTGRGAESVEVLAGSASRLVRLTYSARAGTLEVMEHGAPS
jgi:hypothetical protein